MSEKLSKRMQSIRKKIDLNKQYSLKEALDFLLSSSAVKFLESVDVAINLGVDTRKTSVRGAVVLPHGTGRKIRVAAFVQGEKVKEAEQAKADVIGFEDLAEEIKKGNINFDVLVATPDAMPFIGKLGQILGPKGLMPNPKNGTVTTNIADAVINAKTAVQYRADKFGIVHCSIGKINFKVPALIENLHTLIGVLKKAKPQNAKGVYLKKMTLSTTMGAGLVIDLASINT
jgi:large subunit ribosomal protein L1